MLKAAVSCDLARVSNEVTSVMSDTAAITANETFSDEISSSLRSRSNERRLDTICASVMLTSLVDDTYVNDATHAALNALCASSSNSSTEV